MAITKNSELGSVSSGIRICVTEVYKARERQETTSEQASTIGTRESCCNTGESKRRFEKRNCG